MSAAAEATAEAKGNLVKFFSGHAPFEALNAADQWCHDHNISVGPVCRDLPRGLMFGSWMVAKWRDLSTVERRRLHGEMHGNSRGPVRVVIYAAHRHLIPETEQ